MVCGVDVRVWIECIMGWVVITDSDRETGNGICMIPWGMVTMGPGFMMVGMAAALEMCMSMPFCRRGKEKFLKIRLHRSVPQCQQQMRLHAKESLEWRPN
jgi:hypothetical protein